MLALEREKSAMGKLEDLERHSHVNFGRAN
jgi:hypothetical protein